MLLICRYKVDEATLQSALRHASLPMVRKDELGNMFAEAATPTPGAHKADADTGPVAAEGSVDGASAAAAAASEAASSQQEQQPASKQAAHSNSSSGGSRVQTGNRGFAWRAQEVAS